MEMIVQEIILLLSRCLCNYTDEKNKFNHSRFHFKGYYLGQKIVNIDVQQSNGRPLEIDEDYLLWIKVLSIEKGLLKALAVKAKKIT